MIGQLVNPDLTFKMPVMSCRFVNQVTARHCDLRSIAYPNGAEVRLQSGFFWISVEVELLLGYAVVEQG
jgi:hypothetical protein